MIDHISESNWYKSFADSEYSFSNKEFKKLVVPNALFKENANAKVAYFEKLCDLVHSHFMINLSSSISIYEFETMKIESLKACLDLLQNRIPSSNKKMKNVFKVLSLYNKFYEDYDYALLFSRTENNSVNLSEKIQSLKTAVSGNINSSFQESLVNELNLLEKQFEESFGLLSLYNKREIGHSIYGKRSVFTIDGVEAKIDDYNFYKFDGIFDEVIFDNDTISLNVSEVYVHENNVFIMPEVFTNSLQIASRKSAEFDLTEVNKQFPVIRSSAMFQHCCDIIKQQNGSHISNEVASNKLIRFLKDKDPKYFEVILDIISKYKCITNEEINVFGSDLVEYLDSQEAFVTTLKDYRKDDNGLSLILGDRLNQKIPRNKERYNILKNGGLFFLQPSDYTTIVIFSDVGISGSQLKSSIDRYLLNDQKDSEMHTSSKEVFKSNFTNLKKIILLNCIYTDSYEENVRNYLKGKHKEFLGKNDLDVEFKGTKVYVDSDYSYRELHQNIKSMFIDFLNDYYPHMFEQNLFGSQTYSDYLEKVEDDDKKHRYLLLARYRSMPKFRHVVFDKVIFEYRNG